jgi:ABC-type glycerol-3-phosphate transport system substrate-binding protein
LVLGAGLAGGSILAACGSPTVSAPTEAPKPPAVAATVAATPAATVAATANPQKQQITIRYMPDVSANADGDRWAAQQYQDKTGITVKVEGAPYADIPTKTEAQFVTGTLQDTVYSAIKYYPYMIWKGVYLAIDDLVKAKDPGMSDFFPAAIDSLRFEGKLYGLPNVVRPAQRDVIEYNKDLADKAGVTPVGPGEATYDWWQQLALKTSKPDAQQFGISINPRSYYDWQSMSLGYGGRLLSQDGKKLVWTTDANSQKYTQWVLDLIKAHAMPRKADTQGGDFLGQKLMSRGTVISSLPQDLKDTGGKFKMEVTLAPTGPAGRGTGAFVNPFCIYSKTKYPDESYGLLLALTAYETGMWAFDHGIAAAPQARRSQWMTDRVVKTHPVYPVMIKWMDQPFEPFPMPWNLRFQELFDTWQNQTDALWDGQVAYSLDFAAKVEQECQKILDLPRP